MSESEMRRNVKRKGKNCITSSNLTETQNKSSDANKLVDMTMENMYCKIIAFALFHLYFAIIFVCKTYFLLPFFILFTKSNFSQYFPFLLQYFNFFANICGIDLTPYMSTSEHICNILFLLKILNYCHDGGN